MGPVRGPKSIVDIDISQFRKRGSESLHFCRVSLDLKKRKNNKFVQFWYTELILKLKSKSVI